FAAMILMGGLGGAALHPLLRSIPSGGDSIAMLGRQGSNTFLRVSFRTWVSVALGIVFLMVAKPDLLESVAIITLAALVGATAGLVGARSSGVRESDNHDCEAAPQAMGGSR